MSNAPTSPCTECGMSCHAGEYHPFAACLMFKACKDSAIVRANLDSVLERVTIDVSELLDDYTTLESFSGKHPIFLMAKEIDSWRHIQPEPVGHVDAEGTPHLSCAVKGGYLYWGHAPK